MSVSKEEFYFDSRDGKTRLHAISWAPEEKPVAICQIIHGMNEYIDRYDRVARYLAERGIYVTGEDHLGHGKSVEEGGTYGYFAENDSATVLVRDVHRLKKMTQEKFPGVPYYILGHSMGSMIMRNYLLRYGTGINGSVIMGTGTVPLSTLRPAKGFIRFLMLFKGPKYVSKMVAKMTFAHYNDRLPDAKTDYDWVTGDPQELDKYIHDPLCTGFFFTLNGFETLTELTIRMQDKKQMETIPKKLPILITSGEEDPVGNWGKDPKELYDTYLQMGMDHVTLKMYPGLRHEVLNETEKEQTMEDLYNWLKNQYTSIASDDA